MADPPAQSQKKMNTYTVAPLKLQHNNSMLVNNMLDLQSHFPHLFKNKCLKIHHGFRIK